MKLKNLKKIKKFMAMFLCVLMVMNVAVPALATVIASDSDATEPTEHIVMNLDEGVNPCGTCGNIPCECEPAEVCGTCGKEPCECEPVEEACTTCGKEPCECAPAEVCADCGKEPCECEPVEEACTTCGKKPCECAPAEVCADCGKDPCECEPEEVCATCGKAPCECEPMEVCADCGKASCECAPAEVCADCGKEICECVVCETCGEKNCEGHEENVEEASPSDATCADCGEAPCTCEVCETCGEKKCEGHKSSVCEYCGVKETEDMVHKKECPLYEVVFSVYEQLSNTTTLLDFRTIMLAEENREDVLALTAEEIDVLMRHVEELYESIEEPSEDDTYYFEELLETLTYLPAMECPECGEFGGHAENCVRNISMLPSSGTVGATDITKNETWDLTGDITLTGTIKIKSGATLIIKNNASKTTRTVKRSNNFTGDMFYVEAGGTLHVNGYDWNNGQWNNGPVVIDGNEKVKATGQIIYCSGKLSLRDMVIRNNKGVYAIWLGGTGAGSYVDQYHYTTVEITRTLIEKSNSISGGGIFIAGSTPAGYTVEIWNSKIYQCTAVDGSAIYFSGAGQAKVDMKTSVVDDCDTIDTLEDSTGYYGGALRTNGNGKFKFTMQDSVVRNCNSWKFGGGIYWNASGEGAKLIVEDCQFLNNTAAEMGGGMFLEGSDMTIKASSGIVSEPVTSGIPGNLTGTLIQNNEAPNGGGISYKCYSNSIEVQVPTTVANFNENVIFNNNKGTNGAALAYNMHDTHNYPNGATFTFNINGAQFTNNEATGNGGAIYVYKCRDDYVCTVNFNSGTVSDNSAKNGGALAITTANGITVGGTFNMKGGTLSNNTASASGGAVYLENGSFNMSGGTAEKNNAANGGSAYVTGGDFTMSGGEMKKNEATKDGGAVYIRGGDIHMTGGSINENEASANGGAAYVAGGNVTIEHGTIDGNKAMGTTETTGNGGAVYMAATTAKLIMESGTMNNNEAANDGGAIYANGGTIKIGLEDCKEESTDELKTCTHHTMKGANRNHPEISQNKAADTGGGIALADGIVHFYCGSAIDNQALYKGVGKNVFMDGGDFYMYDGANVGLPRDPDLVIIGGILHNECKTENYLELHYYMTNDSTATAMVGMAQYQEIMNLPDGEYYWPKYASDNNLVFLGWTAQGSESGDQDNEFVRNKEQYVNSGEPVEILDAPSSGTDDTAENTDRLFDGTNDKKIHLYALWAPKTSTITYKNGVTDATIPNTDTEPDNPETYDFSRESNELLIQPVEHNGYDLVGWYIYQNVGQNANWNNALNDTSYEPVTTGKQPVYMKLDTRNGVLELEAGYTNFGDITLIADFVPAYTDLRITKTGWNTIDENQTFIFKVTGTPTNTDLESVDMTVTIHGNGCVLIKELPVGSYEVEEITSWSWRYTPNNKVQQVELVDSAKTEQVDFANTRTKKYWLSGDCLEENRWSNKQVDKYFVVKKKDNSPFVTQ